MGGISRTVVQQQLPDVLKQLNVVVQADAKVIATLVELAKGLTDPHASLSMRHEIAVSIQESLGRMHKNAVGTSNHIKEILKYV